MNKISSSRSKPHHSIIDRNLGGKIDYLDSFSIDINDAEGDSIDVLTAMLFTALPRWARGLLKLRDVLVRPFGLATGLIPSQASIDKSIHFAVGDRAIFFTVIDRTASEIVMSEDDKHLSFRTSLARVRMMDGRADTLHLTTLVQFHHWYGRLYFLPVKPFHKAIMKSLLRQLAKRKRTPPIYEEVPCNPS